MLERLIEVSEKYNGYNGKGGSGVEIEYAHEAVSEKRRKAVARGIAATDATITALYEEFSDPKVYPRFQVVSNRANEALEELLPDADLASLCEAELSPDWVMATIIDRPEEVIAVAGILSGARKLAGRFQQIARAVDIEVD